MFAPCGHIVHLYLTPCTAEVGGSSRWVQLEFKMFAVPLFARNCLCAIGTDSLCPVDSLEINVGEWEEKLLWRTFLIYMLNTDCCRCLQMFLWLFQKCVGIALCALRQEWGNLQLCQLLSTLLQGLGFYTYMNFLLYLTYIGSFGKSKV